MRILFVLALIAAPASAQVQPAPRPADAVQQKAERTVCRSIEETGSRLASKKVCMTVSQWREQNMREREDVEEAQRRAYQPH